LISNTDENQNDHFIEENSNNNNKIFTIEGGDSKAKRSKWAKNKSGSQHKDYTPKEVAKMRKSKTSGDVKSSASGWKCCLF
jgi:hypothetical protein